VDDEQAEKEELELELLEKEQKILELERALLGGSSAKKPALGRSRSYRFDSTDPGTPLPKGGDLLCEDSPAPVPKKIPSPNIETTGNMFETVVKQKARIEELETMLRKSQQNYVTVIQQLHDRDDLLNQSDLAIQGLYNKNAALEAEVLKLRQFAAG